jgi:hypothetical protein
MLSMLGHVDRCLGQPRAAHVHPEDTPWIPQGEYVRWAYDDVVAPTCWWLQCYQLQGVEERVQAIETFPSHRSRGGGTKSAEEGLPHGVCVLGLFVHNF